MKGISVNEHKKIDYITKKYFKKDKEIKKVVSEIYNLQLFKDTVETTINKYKNTKDPKLLEDIKKNGKEFYKTFNKLKEKISSFQDKMLDESLNLQKDYAIKAGEIIKKIGKEVGKDKNLNAEIDKLSKGIIKKQNEINKINNKIGDMLTYSRGVIEELKKYNVKV